MGIPKGIDDLARKLRRMSRKKMGDNDSLNQWVTITGFILATDFNRHGKVVEVAVETDDFNQYIVTTDRKGKELFGLLYSRVTIHGIVSSEDAHGNAIVTIEDYEVNDNRPLIDDVEKGKS